MTLRYVLVHLDKSDGSAARADVAISLAKTLRRPTGSAVRRVRPRRSRSLASRNRYLFVERAAGKAQAAFQQHAASFGIEAEWLADIGSNDNEVNRAVVLRARDADLVVLGQYEPAAADGRVPETLVETTILQSGRPVLVVPFAGHFRGGGPSRRHRLERQPRGGTGCPRCAAAARSGRAGDAAGFGGCRIGLEQYGSGAVGRRHHPPPDDHGVTAEVDRLVFDSASIEPAERLLSYLADAGADLLVMGAAGQQMGRAAAKRSLTRHVLAHITVPTLLSY